jgi:glucose-6-phosphate isomerase
MIEFGVDEKLQQEAVSLLHPKALHARTVLHQKTGKGGQFLGWLDLPQMMLQQLPVIETFAQNLHQCADVVVVIGIGGSYLGAKAVIEALSTANDWRAPKIIYAGHHLSETYHAALLQYLHTVDYAVMAISKSGMTIEPAVAFRLLQTHCIQKYGRTEAQKRIICITDKQQGALSEIAAKENYPLLPIPADVGGRYSVLSAVGLLPIAAAGGNIQSLLEGADAMRKQLFADENHAAVEYATVRNYLLCKGFNMEILATFQPQFACLQEWWKQLFGESEGKNGKGIFPASMIYTTDLHSLGQYMQQGQRLMFETFLRVKETAARCLIPPREGNEDRLNDLSGKRLCQINAIAEEATLSAHAQGNVPVLQIAIERIEEFAIGELLYFFEYACAVSAYMLDVNPFDQPGVETYKNNMSVLLKNIDKPIP